MDLKSEKLKLDNGRKFPDACCKKNSAQDDVPWSFGFLNSEKQKSVSGLQTHQLVFLSLEVILGTKNQNKKDTRELLQR